MDQFHHLFMSSFFTLLFLSYSIERSKKIWAYFKRKVIIEVLIKAVCKHVGEIDKRIPEMPVLLHLNAEMLLRKEKRKLDLTT